MNAYLSSIAITARVRPDGSLAPFEQRTFDLMLDQRQEQNKMLREARRILRQIGYEARTVAFSSNPGN